jgi:hypothetical protein
LVHSMQYFECPLFTVSQMGHLTFMSAKFSERLRGIRALPPAPFFAPPKRCFAPP